MAYVNKGIDRSAPMNRTGAFPLDEKSYFESYATALASAQTAEPAGSSATSYYFGQLMTVFEDNIVKTYKIVPTEVSSEVEDENGEKQIEVSTVGTLEQIDAATVYTTEATPTISSEIDENLKITSEIVLSSIQPKHIDTNEVWYFDSNYAD
jgi:hypothetical protein